jgi:hypothetical protein
MVRDETGGAARTPGPMTAGTTDARDGAPPRRAFVARRPASTALAADILRDGYGPAAYRIARNSVRGGAAQRRFWRLVALRLWWDRGRERRPY